MPTTKRKYYADAYAHDDAFDPSVLCHVFIPGTGARNARQSLFCFIAPPPRGTARLNNKDLIRVHYNVSTTSHCG